MRQAIHWIGSQTIANDRTDLKCSALHRTTRKRAHRCAHTRATHTRARAIMSLRYAALLAPACAFTHPQQPRRIVLRRDYSSIDDVFDSVFDDAFDAWSPFGSRRRDPWSQFGLSRRRSPLAQQFGQLKRLSQAFEEQLQRVDEDDFLADTRSGSAASQEPRKTRPPPRTATSSL